MWIIRYVHSKDHTDYSIMTIGSFNGIFCKFSYFTTYLLSPVRDCGRLDPPSNGDIRTTGTGVGDTATYTCNPGFMLVGETTRTFLDNGFWSETAPICTRKILMAKVSNCL